ncbi:ATP-binding cassette domain-containing protein [Neptuniibacter sp. QD48_55]|uniref:ATP-binding cassette domain-containing protein n=1 Tax=Neptuniibacter sp. QD48_55 TaxID=3398212 RepID=UPI0039F4CE6C
MKQHRGLASDMVVVKTISNKLGMGYGHIVLCSFFLALFDAFSISFVYVSLSKMMGGDSNLITKFLDENIGVKAEVYFFVACFSFLSRSLVMYFVERMMICYSQCIQVVLRTKISEVFLKKGFVGQIHDIHDLLTRQVMQFGNVVVLSLLKIHSDFFAISIILATSLILLPKETLIVFATIFVLVAVAYLIFSRTIRAKGAHTNELSARLSSLFDVIIRHQKDIVTHSANSFFLHKIENRAKDVSENNEYALCSAILIRYSVEILFGLGLVLVGALIVIGYLGKDEVPLIGTFLVIALRTLPVGYSFFQHMIRIKYAGASVEKIQEFLTSDEESSKDKNTATINKSIPFNSLQVSNLSVSNSNQSLNRLKRLSFSIGMGDRLAIVGRSGVGKSTLINVLSGFIPFEEGKIEWEFGGEKYSALEVQAKISMVSQTPLVLEGTISENICLGTAYNESLLIAVIEKLDLASSFKLNSKELLNYSVEDAGINVSGGQRYKIAIARALYHQNDVLIFDEPTAALDESSRTELINLFKSLAGDVSIIVVTHDEMLEKSFNKVIKL